MPGSAPVIHPCSELLGKDLAWSTSGKLPFVFRCLTADFIGHGHERYVQPLRVSAMVLEVGKNLYSKKIPMLT